MERMREEGSGIRMMIRRGKEREQRTRGPAAGREGSPTHVKQGGEERSRVVGIRESWVRWRGWEKEDKKNYGYWARKWDV